MKQVTKTDKIISLLRASMGEEAQVDDLKVYEAIALNTKPIRKKHPIYNGARAERSLLVEMAEALAVESRPIQIQHEQSALPVGRVFHGEVLDDGLNSELRVLFFIDPTAAETSAKIDHGSVDQVSVSFMSKQAICSASGFDFLGEGVSPELIWTGTDPQGNKIGKDGVYTRLSGLDSFLELSLVGLGGAQGARIVNREQSHFGSSLQRLAATGVDPNSLILVASLGSQSMDITELVKELTDVKTELALKTAEIENLTAQVAELTTTNAELSAKPEDVPNPELDLALETLSGIAKDVLTASGKLDITVPTTAAELSSLINTESEALKLVLKAGGVSKDTPTDLNLNTMRDLSGFRASN